MQYVDSRFTETKLHNASPCYKKTALARGGVAGEGTQLPQNLLARHFLNSVIFYCFLSNGLALCLGEQVPTLKCVLHSHIRKNICQYFASVSEDLQWRSAHAGFIFYDYCLLYSALQNSGILNVYGFECVCMLLCSRYSVLVVFLTDSTSFCIFFRD
jgi:hypothetical protein